MSKMVQIRNVPDAVHRRLKIRAVEADLSLSDYLKREIARIAERPTLEELLERLERQGELTLAEPIEEAVRAEREGR